MKWRQLLDDERVGQKDQFAKGGIINPEYRGIGNGHPYLGRFANDPIFYAAGWRVWRKVEADQGPVDPLDDPFNDLIPVNAADQPLGRIIQYDVPARPAPKAYAPVRRRLPGNPFLSRPLPLP